MPGLFAYLLSDGYPIQKLETPNTQLSQEEVGKYPIASNHYLELCVYPITSLREINTLLKAQHINIVTVRVGSLFHYYHDVCTLSHLSEKLTLHSKLNISI